MKNILNNIVFNTTIDCFIPDNQKCRSCGQCCKGFTMTHNGILLTNGLEINGEVLTRFNIFKFIKQVLPQYFLDRLSVKVGESGAFVFSCSFQTKKGLCSIHNKNKPTFCSSWFCNETNSEKSKEMV